MADISKFKLDATNPSSPVYNLKDELARFERISYAQWQLMTPEQQAAKPYYIYDYPSERFINAENVGYDNTESGLTAEDVQEAVDEVNSKLTGYLNTRNVTSAVISSIVPGANVIPVNFSYAIPQGMKPRFIGYNGNDKTLNVVPVNAIQPLGDNDTQANIVVFNPTDATYTDVTVYACLGLVKA